MLVRHARTLLTSTALVSLPLAPAIAQSATTLPQQGSVVAGAATISSGADSLTVYQSSTNAIINWNSFSIGEGGSVNFENGSGATLNRVTGFSSSQIDGSLSATGSLYLVNPNGIAIGSTGEVVTGGSFVASTQDIGDSAFMAGGDRLFSGQSQAAVVNRGRIGALGGDVALIARKIENSGTIEASSGTAALAAGYEVLVRDAALSDGKFVVMAGGSDTEAKTTGVIKAVDVELRANGGNVYALAGNAGSITRATGVANEGGRIFLTAGSGDVTVDQKLQARASADTETKGGQIRISAGKATISGTLDAAGSGDSGGTVVVAADDITLANSASVDVSGTTGGLMLIGGDYQGGKDTAANFLDEAVSTASTVTVEEGASLTADGSNGSGGTIVVWSDEATLFAGAISATGTGDGATGGFAEVSGKQVLDYTGTADLRSEGGSFGTLLLDPYNLTISTGSTSNVSGFAATGNNSVLNVTTLTNALATANVTVSTGSGTSPGTQAGDITVAAPISWSANSILTLSAAGAVNINSDITATGDSAGLVLTFGASRYNLNDGARVTLSGADASLSINGTAYTLIHNVDDLQNIVSTGTYALAVDIDASQTADWNSGAGFIPISGFQGALHGLGHTIDGLTIQTASTGAVGLFTGINLTTVRDLTLANIDISAPNAERVGALAGLMENAIIDNVHVTGSVSGLNDVGGIGGWVSDSVFSDVSSAANVTATGDRVGGLIGRSYYGLAITDAYVTGAVSGSNEVGGLIGRMTDADATLTNVYASGTVSGTSDAGGLIGRIFTSDPILPSNITLTDAYWDATASGQTAAIGTTDAGSVVTGGAVDVASAPRSQSTYAGFDFTNTWIMVDGETRPMLRSEHSSVIFTSTALQLISMNLAGSYSLGTDIDFTGAFAANSNGSYSGIWGASGFVPLGSSATRFTGTLDGQGHTITGLTINRAATSNVGLFAYTSGATIRDLGLVGGSARGLSYVGGLSANSAGGTISNVFNTGSVTATISGSGLVFAYAGGLVANNTSAISNSYATGTVTASGGDIGGLVGANAQGGTITDSYATGTVSTTTSFAVGGLTGINAGTISGSHAAGTVTGGGAVIGGVGGLVGTNANGGTVTLSYATGAVTGTTSVGGLVGNNSYGGVSQSFATGSVHGSSSVGGLIGTNSLNATYATSVLDSYATGAVTGSSNLGGLIGSNYIAAGTTGRVANNYASGKITGTSSAGGLIGSNSDLVGGAVTANFWNTTTTGKTVGVGSGTAAGATGLTTADMMKLSSFADAGWSIDGVGGTSSVWRIYEGYTAPLLRGFMTDLTVTGGSGTKTYNGTTVSSDVGALIYDPAGYDQSLVFGTATYTASSADAGTYSGANLTLSGLYSSQLGYDISLVANTLTIDPAALTVTADAKTMTYGGALPSLTYAITSGTLYGSDTLSGALATSASSTSNVGDYTIAQGTLAASANYALTYVSANVAVTPATLTITAGNGSMVYGDAVPDIGYSVSGWKNGQTDALLSDIVTSTDATSSSDVGSGYTTSAAGGTLSGAATGNYVFAYADGSFAVTPATLTVTAGNGSMVYGDAVPTIGYSVSGWKNGQTDALLSDVVTSTDATSSSDVGSGYTTSAAGGTLSGAATGNYVFAYADGSFAVTPATLTVTAGNGSMVYGDAVPTIGYSVSGWKNGQTDALLSDIVTSTDATSDSDVGSGYATSAAGGTLSGAATGNYVFAYADGSFAVTPATLTVTAGNGSMVYGEAVPDIGYSVSGWKNGQTDALLSDIVTSTDATSSSDVGNGYTTSAAGGTLSGAATGNYVFAYADGSFAVTPATLTVTAGNGSMIYGDAVPDIGYSVAGWKNGQTDALLSDIVTSTDATSSSDVGNGYTTSAAGGTLSGAATGNYVFTYVDGTFEVLPRATPEGPETTAEPFVETESRDEWLLSRNIERVLLLVSPDASGDHSPRRGCSDGVWSACASLPHPDNLPRGGMIRVSVRP